MGNWDDRGVVVRSHWLIKGLRDEPPEERAFVNGPFSTFRAAEEFLISVAGNPRFVGGTIELTPGPLMYAEAPGYPEVD